MKGSRKGWEELSCLSEVAVREKSVKVKIKLWLWLTTEHHPVLFRTLNFRRCLFITRTTIVCIFFSTAKFSEEDLYPDGSVGCNSRCNRTYNLGCCEQMKASCSLLLHFSNQSGQRMKYLTSSHLIFVSPPWLGGSLSLSIWLYFKTL